MKYWGVDESHIIQAAQTLQSLGLSEAEVNPVLVLCGIKWILSNLHAATAVEPIGKEERVVFERASRLFARDAKKFIKQQSEALKSLAPDSAHTSLPGSMLLLALQIAMNPFFYERREHSSVPVSVRSWLKSGNERRRGNILSFALGAGLMDNAHAHRLLFDVILKAKYSFSNKSGKDISSKVTEVVNRFDAQERIT